MFGPNVCHLHAAGKFFFEIGIAVPVLIFRLFRMKKISHPCFIHFSYYSPGFFVVGISYTILYSSFFRVWKICDSTHFLTGTGNALLPVFFDVGLVGLEPRLVLIISSDKMQKNTLESIYVVATL